MRSSSRVTVTRCIGDTPWGEMQSMMFSYKHHTCDMVGFLARAMRGAASRAGKSGAASSIHGRMQGMCRWGIVPPFARTE
jgi:hypothetical protein